MRKFLFQFLLLVLAAFILFPFSSCVSKKKFLTEVANGVSRDSTLQDINRHNFQLNREVANLKIQLAEKTGESNAFREILDKQDIQIDRLNAEIRKLTNQSLSQQEVLDGAIQLKENELTNRIAQIQSYKDAVTAQELKMQELIGKVANTLYNYENESVSMEVKDGLGYIRLSEKLIFRKGTTRINDNAYNVLEGVANVLYQYPQMDVLVIGHTDSEPVKGKNLKDNWDLSVLRATPVVRMLTKEFGLNPNQVTAGGKGDSKPRTSNDTSTGREQNRRTEIVIYPPSEKILELIKSR